MAAPLAFAFDMMETLVSLAPLGPALGKAGLQASQLPLFFTQVLRDGFALAATDTYRPFGEVVKATAISMLAVEQQKAEPAYDAAAIQELTATFATLPAHPDVLPAFKMLAEKGVPAYVLANGAQAVLRKILDRNQLAGYVKAVVSVDDVQAWKPLAKIYRHAAGAAGVSPDRLCLIAAHPWDCHGAKHAGLMAGFIARKNPYYPAQLMTAADATDTNLSGLLQKLLAL